MPVETQVRSGVGLRWGFAVWGDCCPLLAVELLVSLNELVIKVFRSDACTAKT